ncbi:MAG TPA: SIMPL domain-containing protein [Thermoanaerobaculia bacterium]|nr:SIMPL domain-containing protein [Thermoanaerobaculia bacterium]
MVSRPLLALARPSRRSLGRRGATSLLLLAWALCAPLGAQPAPDGAPDAATVLVRGEAEVQVPPDLARIQLGVTAQSEEAADAQQQVSEIAQRILEALAEADIAERDIRTTGITLYPVYDHRPRPAGQENDGAPRVVGYRASNTVTVRVTDLAKVGTVIDRAIGAGATNVDSLQLTVSDESAARQDALRGAIGDAAGKARAIAESLGRTLGDVVEVQEGGASVTPMFLESAQTMMRSQAAADTPVAGGTVTVNAQVTVRYRLRE